MNVLLFLTALLAGLTGMVSGDRPGARERAVAVASEATAVVESATAIASVIGGLRPDAPRQRRGTGHVTAHPSLALVPALRLAAEQRRE